MGINPRGLVPVLVHDGQVHIESNDILEYLEHLYPDSPLIPEVHSAELAQLLQLEDELNVDLRNLTMRFTAPSKLMQRSSGELEHFLGITPLWLTSPGLSRSIEYYWQGFWQVNSQRAKYYDYPHSGYRPTPFSERTHPKTPIMLSPYMMPA